MTTYPAPADFAEPAPAGDTTEAPPPSPVDRVIDRLRADAARLDWIEAHPIQTKWDHRRGFLVMRGQWTGCGATLRDAVDDLRRQCEE